MARAYIYDTRPDVSYVWSLKVFDLSQKGVSSHRLYDKQIFQIPAGHELNPTFEDLIELAPGTYNVQLLGYEVPFGFDIAKFKDAEVARPYECFGGMQTVTTTPD